jgi:hypothetical protein
MSDGTDWGNIAVGLGTLYVVDKLISKGSKNNILFKPIKATKPQKIKWGK